MKLSITIENLDEFRSSLILRPEERKTIMEYWAADVRDKARENAQSHGSGGCFWQEIADSVHVVEGSVTPESAEVVCDHIAGYHKEFGGIIRAREKPFLTIPVNDLSKRKSVARMKAEGYKIFRPKGRRFLAFMDGDKVVPLFALVKETKPQRAFHWWPDEKETEAMGAAAAEEFLSDRQV